MVSPTFFGRAAGARVLPGPGKAAPAGNTPPQPPSIVVGPEYSGASLDFPAST
ncbi:MAG: hypothetical protein ACR2I1_03335 [Propionibacteriaceae bacterium]